MQEKKKDTHTRYCPNCRCPIDNHQLFLCPRCKAPLPESHPCGRCGRCSSLKSLR